MRQYINLTRNIIGMLVIAETFSTVQLSMLILTDELPAVVEVTFANNSRAFNAVITGPMLVNEIRRLPITL